jgi:hypothetical protein
MNGTHVHTRLIEKGEGGRVGEWVMDEKGKDNK